MDCLIQKLFNATQFWILSISGKTIPPAISGSTGTVYLSIMTFFSTLFQIMSLFSKHIIGSKDEKLLTSNDNESLVNSAS